MLSVLSVWLIVGVIRNFGLVSLACASVSAPFRFLLFSHKTTSYFNVLCCPLLFLFGDRAASPNRVAQQ